MMTDTNLTFPVPKFSAATILAMQNYAMSKYPEEACGLVINGEFVAYDNVSADPCNSFEFARDVILKDITGVEAVIHSHPDGNPFPSKSDMQQQIASDINWGIIKCTKDTAEAPVFWGDFRLEENLIGRQFIPGVNDCYSLVRAYFWQMRQIKLMDMARDDKWWDAGENGENFYLAHFDEAGFRVIQQNEIKAGDGFIGKIFSSVPNHGGIYLDRGLGLHIITNRLSRREAIGPWAKHITCWLRYKADDVVTDKEII
jgi:proteasome lid subunit RPN8/RPN11